MVRELGRGRVLLIGFLLALPLLAAGLLVLDVGKAEEGLIDRRYAEAAVELERLLPQAAGLERERVLFLLGQARLLGGDLDGAVEALERLSRESPNSAWADRAAFERAGALSRRKEYRAAAELLEEKVGALVSEERKELAAGVYLRLAGKALEGEKPDHGRARTFYDLALGLGLQGARAEEVGFEAAGQALALKDWNDAAGRLREFIGRWPESARLAQARFLLGDALRQWGRTLEARLALRETVRLHPGHEASAKALYALAEAYGMPAPPTDNDLVQGVSALRKLIAGFPKHELSPKAALAVARGWANRGRHQEALTEVEALIGEYADRRVEEVAEARALKGAILRAQGKHQEAIAAYRGYLSAHPDHGQWRAAQAAVVDCEWEEALALKARGKEHYARVAELLVAFVGRHPLDGRNPGALLLMGKLELERERFKEAQAALRECAARFPRTEEAGEAIYLVGAIHEEKLSDPGRAIETWQGLDWGSWSGRAQERMRRLREPALTLLTERIYQTSEKPVFQVVSRNVPALRVRIFKLDLATYFRATHTASEIERLQIEVIEPDTTFESGVEGYRPWVETKREVAVPFEGPGAYVVKVDDKKLEATTLVLVTDIALTTKATRAGLFVFAQNTREERPEAGARVVVSNGTKILAEGETGADGTWLYHSEELLTAPELRVFALGVGGSGAATLGLSGLGAPRGLEAKGYVYTDRPAYRPGQKVSMRAVVRDVAGGIYTIPEIKSYRVSFVDPAGVPLGTVPAELTAFGTLSAEMELPGEARLGGWSVRVAQAVPGGRAFTGTFQVDLYTVPKVKCELLPESPVVMRGEPIKGKVRVAWFYGEPLSGEPVEIQMQMPGGRLQVSAVTDAAGLAPFTFETLDFSEEGMALLQARAPGRDAGAMERVLVATVALTPAVALVREVYLAGETLEAQVSARDRTGKPAAATLTVQLIRKVKALDGSLGEVEAGRMEVATDGVRGEARARFEVEQGGAHVVRATGRDRFGNQVSGEAAFLASGADDEVKLRLLADKERWRVGEGLSVRVVNRAGRRLALFTAEADRVMKWWTKVLPEGESIFEMGLDGSHAPNFRLAASMVDGKHLREAAADFLVDQALAVAVEPGARAAAPGEKLAVSITVKDPSGAPAAAELSVAAVDEGLLALYPSERVKIQEFFYGARRSIEVRTAASCTFRYEGKTTKVPEELLREEQRALEEARRAAPAPATPAPHTGFLGGGAGGRGRPAGRSRGEAPAEDRLEMELADKDAKREPMEKAKQLDQASLNRRARKGAGIFMRDAEEMSEGSEESWSEDGVPERSDFPEVAFWSPAVATGKDGKAAVEIELPGTLTTWKLLACGVTVETLVGEGEGSLQARKPLLVEVELPRRAVEGDTLAPIAVVRNLSDQPVKALLEVKAGAGGPLAACEFELAAGGSGELPFELKAAVPGELELRVSAAGGGFSDTLVRKLIIDPLGTRFLAGAAGVESADRVVELELPAGKTWAKRGLKVTLGGEVRGELVRSALAAGVYPHRMQVETTYGRISRGLGALSALELAGRGTALDAATLQKLRDLALAAIGSLASEMDGGWAWNKGGKQDLGTTALAVHFLTKASQAGLEVPPVILSGGIQVLKQGFGTTQDALLRARILEALALSREAPLEWLNAHRRRAGEFDGRTLSALLSAFVASGRPEAAAELAPMLRARARRASDGLFYWSDEVVQAERKIAPPTSSPDVESTGLAVRALLLVDPGDEAAVKGAAWLQGRKVWGAWPTPAGHAAALAALCLLEGRAAAEASEGRVRLIVNEVEVGAAALRASAATVFEVAEPRDGKNRLVLKLEGRGRFAWSAVLEGTTKGLDPGLRNQYLALERTVLAAPALHKGRELPAGFSVVAGPVRTYENLATLVAVGRTVQVRVVIGDVKERPFAGGNLVLVEPLPAGATLVPGSVKGPVELVQAGDGAVTFFLGRHRSRSEIRYEIGGYIPGAYVALPARLYAVERPDQVSESGPGTLEVVPRGGAQRDPYRLTPDELYHRGLALFEERAYAAATADFDELLKGWRLQPAPLRAVARARLELAAKGGEPRRVVEAFELLREAWPEMELPFEQVMQVGRSYLKIGEFERAGQVFLAVADASFLKEIRVGGTLEEQGEHLEAVAHALKLCMSYPARPLVRQAYLAMGQELARKAGELAPGQRLGEKGPGKTELLGQSLGLLREFLVLHPEDSQAPEATFALASGHVGLKGWEAALSWATAGARRYAESRWVDELLYLRGYALFALGRYEDALETLGKVAQGRFPDGAGNQVESDSKWLSVYLMGQIHHAQGRRALAEEHYEKVKDRFSDAAENLEFLRLRRLEIPEVTLLKPADRAEVELKWRNVKEAVIRIYRVDLLRLYVLQRSLAGIQGVQLSGIKPIEERTLSLPEHGFLEEGKLKASLPLERPGAYLLLVQSSDLVATGLVLRTSLELKVQEEPGTGRVGVHVLRAGSPVPEAYVKVVGSADGLFRSGETDLRGIFAAQGVSGMATVLVKAGDEYAIHRGSAPLLAQTRQRVQAGKPGQTELNLIQTLEESNTLIQQDARRQLDSLFRNKQQGVQIQGIDK